MLAIGREPAAQLPDQALDLALGLGVSRQTGIDVEADGAGIGPVVAVEGAPGAGAVNDTGLEVVDAHHGRYAAQSAQGFIVYLVPGELVLAWGPDDGREARERQLEGKHRQVLALPGDQDTRELAPVGLGLRAGGCFDTAPGPDPGLGKMGLEVALQRAPAAGVVVFAHQPVVQGGKVQRSVLIEPLQPGRDGVLEIGGEVFLLATPVRGPLAQSVQVITNSVLVNAKESGNGAVALAVSGKGLDGHTSLLIECVCHHAPPPGEEVSVSGEGANVINSSAQDWVSP